MYIKKNKEIVNVKRLINIEAFSLSLSFYLLPCRPIETARNNRLAINDSKLVMHKLITVIFLVRNTKLFIESDHVSSLTRIHLVIIRNNLDIDTTFMRIDQDICSIIICQGENAHK